MSKLAFFLLLTLSLGCAAPPRDRENHSLANDLVTLEIAPEIGGRVLQYRLGDYGFFWVNAELDGAAPPASGLGPDESWLNWGGDKLWLAPQGWDGEHQWPGPPDAILDGGPYEHRWIEEDGRRVGVELTSAPSPASGVRLSRVVRVHPGSSRVSVDATLTNVDTKPRRWGIWAHTQFDGSNRHGSGHNDQLRAYCPLNPWSRFPRGYDVLFGLVNNPSFQVDSERGMLRVEYRRQVGKAGVDSLAGWVATVDARDGYAFVQRFVAEPNEEYPEGSSVEFWVNGAGAFYAWGQVNELEDDPETNPYVFESEVLSPYRDLAPGASGSFHYEWYAAKVPPGSEVVAANDVGVTCQPLKCTLAGDSVLFEGSFGVFWTGYARAEFLDASESVVGTPAFEVEVSPLRALVVSKSSAPLPDGATTAVITIVDPSGTPLGELARAPLQR